MFCIGIHFLHVVQTKGFFLLWWTVAAYIMVAKWYIVDIAVSCYWQWEGRRKNKDREAARQNQLFLLSRGFYTKYVQSNAGYSRDRIQIVWTNRNCKIWCIFVSKWETEFGKAFLYTVFQNDILYAGKVFCGMWDNVCSLDIFLFALHILYPSCRWREPCEHKLLFFSLRRFSYGRRHCVQYSMCNG